MRTVVIYIIFYNIFSLPTYIKIGRISFIINKLYYYVKVLRINKNLVLKLKSIFILVNLLSNLVIL